MTKARHAGVYHRIVNLDRREFIDPARLGVLPTAFEQLHERPSTPHALFLLTLASNHGGLGDLDDVNGAAEVYGRWAGDRIVTVSTTTRCDDFQILDTDPSPSDIYALCSDQGRYRDISNLVLPVLEQVVET